MGTEDVRQLELGSSVEPPVAVQDPECEHPGYSRSDGPNCLICGVRVADTNS